MGQIALQVLSLCIYTHPMSMSTPPLTLFGDCKAIAIYLTDELNTAGCQVIRSFDLQEARKAHLDCACPHHGDAQCSCQMIFLLVYFSDEAPNTIILHGHDGATFVSWDEALSNHRKEMLLNLVHPFLKKAEIDQPKKKILET